MCSCLVLFFFFFNDTATTEIYTLSLHDALPISGNDGDTGRLHAAPRLCLVAHGADGQRWRAHEDEPGLRRSEEHTSELQSQSNLVCRLLLEKKKTQVRHQTHCTLTRRHRHQHIT